MILKSNIPITSLEDWIDELREFQLDDIFENHILGRAYEYLEKIEINMKSSSKRIAKVAQYDVSLSLVENQLIGKCSCPYQDRCKHLAALILYTKKIDF